MGVSSSESHHLTAFCGTFTVSSGVLPKIMGFYPPSDRIVEINTWTLESGDLEAGLTTNQYPTYNIQQPWIYEAPLP